MRGKYNSRFDRLIVNNRWRKRHYSRLDTWVLFGLQEYWAGPHDMCWKICLFGIDFCFWIKRTWVEDTNQE